MLEILRTIALRLALCLAASWLAWKFGGKTSAVWTAALYGVALARPLIDLASEVRHQMRRGVWHDVEGRHYSFRGRAIRVLTDADHQRWVRLADVRAAVGFTAGDATLRVTYPGAWQMLGRPPEAFLREDALVTHLAKERAPDAAKFRHWAEREIAFPGRRERERLGIPEPRLNMEAADSG
jgi:hypothetical protein